VGCVGEARLFGVAAHTGLRLARRKQEGGPALRAFMFISFFMLHLYLRTVRNMASDKTTAPCDSTSQHPTLNTHHPALIAPLMCLFIETGYVWLTRTGTCSLGYALMPLRSTLTPHPALSHFRNHRRSQEPCPSPRARPPPCIHPPSRNLWTRLAGPRPGGRCSCPGRG